MGSFKCMEHRKQRVDENVRSGKAFKFAFNLGNGYIQHFRTAGMVEKPESAGRLFLFIMGMFTGMAMLMMMNRTFRWMLMRDKIMRQQYRVGGSKENKYDASF